MTYLEADDALFDLGVESNAYRNPKHLYVFTSSVLVRVGHDEDEEDPERFEKIDLTPQQAVRLRDVLVERWPLEMFPAKPLVEKRGYGA